MSADGGLVGGGMERLKVELVQRGVTAQAAVFAGDVAVEFGFTELALVA